MDNATAALVLIELRQAAERGELSQQEYTAAVQELQSGGTK